MKMAKLRTTHQIGGNNLPSGTLVEILDAKSVRVQSVWPGIQHRMSKDAEVVQFSVVSFPLLIPKSKLDYE